MSHLGAYKNHSTAEVRWALLVLLILVVAMAVMAWAVRTQAGQVSAQQRALVLQASQASYERELGQLVEVARVIIKRMADQPGDLQVKQRQVLAVLAELQLGRNGYFFVYDAQGRLMLDPQSMQLQGVDFCDPSQGPGMQQASYILNTANQGGGLVQYDWQKPSSQQKSSKISYVAPAERWGWTIGTGVYIDDIGDSLERIERSAQKNLDVIFEVTFLLGLLFLILVFGIYYGVHRRIFIGVNRQIMKLRGEVAQGEEQVRESFARDLHDGVLQVMASTQYLLESAKHQHGPATAASQARNATAEVLIDRALTQLGSALRDVRLMMHRINNASIAQGLEPAMAQLLETARELGFSTSLNLQGPLEAMPQAMQLDVYRITQEAVSNAHHHSQGDVIEVSLRVQAHGVLLSIRDNGRGVQSTAAVDPQRGMGVRNIKARVAQHGGSCHWYADATGVELAIELPIDLSWHFPVEPARKEGP